MKSSVCTLVSAVVLTCGVAFAQSSQQSSTGARATSGSGDGTPVTLVGCLQRESDYRRQNDSGRGGVAATGAGLGNEYVLVNAMRADSAATASASAVDCATATAGTGEAYELTGENERNLQAFVGRRIEITGMLKEADTEPSPVGTSGAAGSRPTGGFDPLGQDLRLHEVNVTSYRDTSAATSTSSTSIQREQQDTAVQPESVAPGAQNQAQAAAQVTQPERQSAQPDDQEQLPRTASPLALIGLLGLLSLGGALAVRRAGR